MTSHPLLYTHMVINSPLLANIKSLMIYHSYIWGIKASNLSLRGCWWLRTEQVPHTAWCPLSLCAVSGESLRELQHHLSYPPPRRGHICPSAPAESSAPAAPRAARPRSGAERLSETGRSQPPGPEEATCAASAPGWHRGTASLLTLQTPAGETEDSR